MIYKANADSHGWRSDVSLTHPNVLTCSCPCATCTGWSDARRIHSLMASRLCGWVTAWRTAGRHATWLHGLDGQIDSHQIL